MQSAYQILVASKPENLAQDHGDLWDSGKTISQDDNQIHYAGTGLQSRESCYWKVRVWDQHDRVSEWSQPALWSMGLLNPADWAASWIGVDQADKPLQKLEVTKAFYHVVGSPEEHDVTAELAAKIKPTGLNANSLALSVNSGAVGAPAKTKIGLHIEYNFNGESFTRDYKEGDRVSIQEPPAEPRYLRASFKVTQPVKRVMLYATALGLYQLHLNGQVVGDHVLAPEWTDYSKRVQYQTYDLTTSIRSGENVIGAILGNGWYSGYWQMWRAQLCPIYGDQPEFKAQLEIDYADGTKQVVATDSQWRGTTDGPMRLSGLYEGETYDALREVPGWDNTGFSDSAWPPVTISNPKAGALVAQRSEPIRVTQEISGKTVTNPKPGVYVIDFGQNLAGWCRMRLHENAGVVVTAQLNEVLLPNGTVYMDNLHAGHLSQGDRQVLRYTCKGAGTETYQPLFTCLGFRYVQVSGLTAMPKPEDFTAEVFHTSFHQVGSFHCSNSLLNQLEQNIQWSQRSNMMGVPTDCCQRDERCGYTGDMNFFMPTALLNFDVAAFFNKWLTDVCDDAQQPDGHFPDHAPTFGPGNGFNVGWGDAGIICPWRMWQAYGDTQVIRDHYTAMQRFMEFVKARGKEGLYSERIGNGNWLNLGGGAGVTEIGTAYAAYDFRLMAEMATAIGKTDDAALYQAEADKIARAFAANCIDADGRIKESSQTGYALAFTMGLVPPDLKDKVAAQFAKEIDRFHGLATGFIGTPRLLPALHLAGRDDLAYQVLLKEDYPSWLFEVRNGATTMWERWNGWTPEKGFADSGMNSFNHYAFGSVGEYMIAEIGGIQARSPGYRTLLIAPAIEPGLTAAEAEYDSIQGKIVCDWELVDGGLKLDITIPANTSARVRVPSNLPDDVTEGGAPSATAPGVKFIDSKDDAADYDIGSGDYHFKVNNWKPK